MTGFLAQFEQPKPQLTGTAPRTEYALAALRDECRNVATAPEGQRNHVLNVAAFSMGSLIEANAIDELSVVDELTSAARRSGLDDSEIIGTVRSGISGGRASGPRTVPESSLVPSIQERSEDRPAGQSGLRNRLLTPTGLRSLPDPQPLIHNVLDQGTTALLYGKWASSKSFLALDWACSVATGRAWQGRPTQQARVLYVVAEGVAGFAGRLDAWETGWQSKISDKQMTFLPMPVNLMTADVDNLVQLVNADGYELIVLDTLARCMVGGDENSARDAGIVIDAMTNLMYATPERRGVVLGVHHTGKDGKTLRGSSAFESGVDTVYFAERDGQAVSLKRKKRKDGPEADVHKLRLSTVTGTDSCVIDALIGENTGENQSESTALLRKLFSELFSQTGVSNPDLRQLAGDNGLSQASFYRARADLLKEGWIVNTGSGARAFFEIANQEDK